MSNPLKAALRRSLEALDNEEIRASSSPRAWAAATLFVLVLLGLNALPPVGAWLQLDPARTALAFVPCLVGAVGVELACRRDQGRFSRAQALWQLYGIWAPQFFAASLIVLSRPPGSHVFSMLFLVTTLAHGQQGRTSARHPAALVLTAVAVLLATLWGDVSGRWGELLLVGAAGLVCELTSGEMAASNVRALEEGTRLRAAVHAQILHQQERDVERMADALYEVTRSNEGMGDALREAVMATGNLARMEPRGGGFVLEVQRLREQLERMEVLTGEISEKGRRVHGAERDPVPLASLAGLVIDGIGYRFPQARLELRQGPGVDRARVLVPGGPTSLRRILENALINACEGDGIRGAARVVLACELRAPGGGVHLEVRDDGPGFPTEILSAPVEGLLTTKDGRLSGLGLYTAECLVRASGGVLERANADGGGAVVRMQLPLADEGVQA